MKKYPSGENPPEGLTATERSEWWLAKSQWHGAESLRYARYSRRASLISWIFLAIAVIALIIGQVMT